MSHSLRPAAAMAALASFGALVAANPAAAKTTTVQLSCTYPLAGVAPIDLLAGFDEATGQLSFKATSRYDADGSDPSYTGFRLTKSASVTGTITASLGGYRGGDVPFSGSVTTDLENATIPGEPPVEFTAKPVTIPGSVDPRGNYGGFDRNDARLSVRGISLNLRTFDAAGKPVTLWNGGVAVPTDSDGDPQSFDVPCTYLSGDSELYYKPSTYRTPTPTPTVTPLPPTPTPTSSGVKYSYSLAGQATLKTLTTGKLPLAGRADATLQLASGNFTAALSLNPTRGNLVALGFLPVVADVALVPQGDATGQLTDAGLSVNTKVRIKLPKVTLFGLQLAGGANCQAKNPSDIKLKSPGEFSPLDGGTIAGTFTISDLTGCGGLTGLVSPLTAGKGNAIALALTPLVKPSPTPTPSPAPTASVKRTNTPLPPTSTPFGTLPAGGTATPTPQPSPTATVIRTYPPTATVTTRPPTPQPQTTPTPVPRSK